MSVRAAQDAGVQHPGHAEVVSVLAASRDRVRRRSSWATTPPRTRPALNAHTQFPGSLSVASMIAPVSRYSGELPVMHERSGLASAVASDPAALSRCAAFLPCSLTALQRAFSRALAAWWGCCRPPTHRRFQRVCRQARLPAAGLDNRRGRPPNGTHSHRLGHPRRFVRLPPPIR
jgi:hypothetical protein